MLLTWDKHDIKDLLDSDEKQRVQRGTKVSRWLQSARGFFYPEDGGDAVLRNVGLHKIYMATSQKTAFFIVTAVKTSTLTFPTLLSFDNVPK
jgi:hypothetical protein